MSASDDYHRHRLRTATKYFKVSVKPFQRLAECEAEPHEKIEKETHSKWQSDSTTTGEADCLIQSFLKFRSSLFKGL